MPPDVDVAARSRAELALWQELRAAYDAIEAALASPDRQDIAALGQRIVRLETELRPLVGELAAARSVPAEHGPNVKQIWRDTDALVASLAARQPALVRAALDARSATAERLEGARAARAQLRRYADGGDAAAQLTSRRA